MAALGAQPGDDVVAADTTTRHVLGPREIAFYESGAVVRIDETVQMLQVPARVRPRSRYGRDHEMASADIVGETTERPANG